MFLFIDTSAKSMVILALFSKSKIIRILKKATGIRQGEKLLPSIDYLLKKEDKKLEAIKSIIVVAGPGGFSSLRTGIAVANALSWFLRVPIVGIRADEVPREENKLVEFLHKKISKAQAQEIIEPLYGKEPNITIKKESRIKN